MLLVGKGLFANKPGISDLKRTVLTGMLCIAPFAHELYVYFGLQTYCRFYGGVVQLEPVKTDKLAFSILGVSTAKVLAHPSLMHVKYIGEHDRLVYWTNASLSADPAACDSEFQVRLENDRKRVAKVLAANAKEQNLCYTDQTSFADPQFELRSGQGLSEYHGSGSILFPRQVRSVEHFELVDRADGAVKSIFLNWQTRTGFLMDLVIPQMRRYKCYDINTESKAVHFPYNQSVYRFLQQAIVAE